MFVKISNVTKGGSTGSADPVEGVKNEFAEAHSRGPRTAGLGLILLESFVRSSRVVFLVSLFGPSLVRDMPWCVLLCFIKPILGNRYGPGVIP